MFKEIDCALLLQKIQGASGSKASLKQICIQKFGNVAKELVNTQIDLKINYLAIPRFLGRSGREIIEFILPSPLSYPHFIPISM